MTNILPPVNMTDVIAVAILAAIIVSAFFVRCFVERVQEPAEDADTRDHMLQSWKEKDCGF